MLSDSYFKTSRLLTEVETAHDDPIDVSERRSSLPGDCQQSLCGIHRVTPDHQSNTNIAKSYQVRLRNKKPQKISYLGPIHQSRSEKKRAFPKGN